MVNMIFGSHLLSKKSRVTDDESLIEHVPNEVLHIIFSFCTVYNDAKSIRATCKRFREVYDKHVLKVNNEKTFKRIAQFYKAIYSSKLNGNFGRSPKFFVHNAKHPRFFEVAQGFFALRQTFLLRAKLIMFEKLFTTEYRKPQYELFLDRKRSVLPDRANNAFALSLQQKRFELSQVYRLVMQREGIIFLPEEIRVLSRLRHLFLSNNALFSLPESLSTLAHLDILDLSYNAFRELPPALAHLAQLKTLLLNNNRIESLPSWLLNLKQLEYLDIQDNVALGKGSACWETRHIVKSLRNRGVKVKQNGDFGCVVI